MYLVKVATNLTKFVADKRLKRAERKNTAAISKLKAAKKSMDETSFELDATRAEVMIQLSKMNQLQEDIMQKHSLNESKQSKLAALLESIDE